MKKTLKILKITVIALSVIIISAAVFVGIYSKIGTSTIKADIKGMGTKLILFTCASIDGTEKHLKFAFCINDKINLKVTVNKTCEARIQSIGKRTTFRSKRIQFYLEPNGDTEIKGTANEIAIDYQIIKGNNLSFQYAELRKVLLPYYEEESKLWFLINQLRETNWEKSRQVMEQFDSLRFLTIAPLRLNWAKQHLDYELSPCILFDIEVPLDTTIKYYNLLSNNAKNAEFGKELADFIKDQKKSKVGISAPDFSQTTFEGKVFRLSQQKGKYVVLDFWGSWCASCLHGIPKMKEYNQKYNSKIVFVGIAGKDKKPDWGKAILTNEMNWTQILNDTLGNDIVKLYGVNVYPTKIILNEKGEIIYSSMGERNDFYSKIDSLMLN